MFYHSLQLSSNNSVRLVHFCYCPWCWINLKTALAAGNASVVEYNKHNNEHSYDRKWQSTDAVSSCFVLKILTLSLSPLLASWCVTLDLFQSLAQDQLMTLKMWIVRLADLEIQGFKAFQTIHVRSKVMQQLALSSEWNFGIHWKLWPSISLSIAFISSPMLLYFCVWVLHQSTGFSFAGFRHEEFHFTCTPQTQACTQVMISVAFHLGKWESLRMTCVREGGLVTRHFMASLLVSLRALQLAPPA